MSEGEIQTCILVWLTKKGFYCWRNNSTGIYDERTRAFRKKIGPGQVLGTADIIGILPTGRLFAVEVKSATGKVSAHQEKFGENIRANGGLFLVARSLRDFVTQFEGACV